MTDEFKAGYALAMKRAATIADSHRAMHLDIGRVEAGMACSSVAGFIINEARENDAWDDSLPLPLVRAKSEAD